MKWARRWGAALRRPPRRARDFTYAGVVLQEKARRLRLVADHARASSDIAGAANFDRKADELVMAVRALTALERATYGSRAAGATIVSATGVEMATGALLRPRSRSDSSYLSARPDAANDHRGAPGRSAPADGGAAARAAGAQGSAASVADHRGEPGERAEGAEREHGRHRPEVDEGRGSVLGHGHVEHHGDRSDDERTEQQGKSEAHPVHAPEPSRPAAVAFAHTIRILKLRAGRLEAAARDESEPGAVDRMYWGVRARDLRAKAVEIRSAIAVLEAAAYGGER